MKNFVTRQQEQVLGFRPGYQQMKQQQQQSAISDWAATEQADVTAIGTALAGIVTLINNLYTQIAALNNSQGTLSASDQAALDAIQTSSATLVSQAQAALAITGVTPPPVPVTPVAP